MDTTDGKLQALQIVSGQVLMDTTDGKLQALVYNTFHSTTAIVDYAIGLKKLTVFLMLLKRQ